MRILQPKPLPKLLLLVFSAYLLSAIVIAFDYHDVSLRSICPICFMRGSLCSAVSQATFAPQLDLQVLYLNLAEVMQGVGLGILTSGICYRGPPA
ncbi:MAG: hypothetical protein A4E57_02196 [Syntrophorhabdaceae bacterium PtaU1.Bin034]|nr:MAG: hypothetical protein A4E57_02196 [Syntrophorhabdaceae bacterium PtaU1.Bin034]